MKYDGFTARAARLPTVLVWLLAVVGGMLWLVRYQMTPGAKADVVPRQWPNGTDISRNKAGLTLVMLVHPQCPCSCASMHELSELMSRAEGKIEAHVLFVEPPGAPKGWCEGDLWNDAKANSKVSVAIDKNGHDAAIFGATTSGEVLVYDSSGVMRFSGGITDGRGHEGDNSGYLAVLALARGERLWAPSTPVYGCSLGVCTIKRDGRSGS